MKAVWYTQHGPAPEVLQWGDLPTPSAGPGEVRVRLLTSGVNPSDVKSRRARPVADPRIVPHGWHYEWRRDTVLNQRDPAYAAARAAGLASTLAQGLKAQVHHLDAGHALMHEDPAISTN